MAQKEKINAVWPKRGEVHLVNFGNTVGSELNKTRPVVVIQNDIGNQFSPVVIIAAISSKFGKALYPTEVAIRKSEGGLHTDSVVLLNQVQTISKERLIKKLGKVEPKTLNKINSAIIISLGLVKI